MNSRACHSHARAGAALAVITTFFVPVRATVSRMQSTASREGSMRRWWVFAVDAQRDRDGASMLSPSAIAAGEPLFAQGARVHTQPMTAAAAVLPMLSRNARRPDLEGQIVRVLHTIIPFHE